MEYTDEQIQAVAKHTVDETPWGLYIYTAGKNINIRREVVDAITGGVFEKELDKLNAAHWSRKRKSIELVAAELEARGYSYSMTYEEESDTQFLDVTLRQSHFRLWYQHGLIIHFILPEKGGSPLHCTAEASDVVDFLEYISKIHEILPGMYEKRHNEACKATIISEVEFPAIEQKVKDFMEPRGITYKLAHRGDWTRLEVQIVKEIWMAKIVHYEEIDDLLRIVPYLIKRPDCIKQDGRGFGIVHK